MYYSGAGGFISGAAELGLFLGGLGFFRGEN